MNDHSGGLLDEGRQSGFLEEDVLGGKEKSQSRNEDDRQSEGFGKPHDSSPESIKETESGSLQDTGNTEADDAQAKPREKKEQRETNGLRSYQLRKSLRQLVTQCFVEMRR